jgi:hypothetical protein
MLQRLEQTLGTDGEPAELSCVEPNYRKRTPHNPVDPSPKTTVASASSMSDSSSEKSAPAPRAVRSTSGVYVQEP